MGIKVTEFKKGRAKFEKKFKNYGGAVSPTGIIYRIDEKAIREILSLATFDLFDNF